MEIFNQVLMDGVQEMIKTDKDFEKRYVDLAEKEKGDTELSLLWKAIFLSRVYIESRFVGIVTLLESTMKAVNSINSAISKLPDKQEFDQVKAELAATLKPSKEELDNLKEIMERGKKGDMYG
jgi:hypothetical protein